MPIRATSIRRSLGAASPRPSGRITRCSSGAHGQVVVAEDVRSLFVDCIHLVENAVSLYQAAALGRVLPLTEREMDDFLRAFKRDKHVAKLWTYYVGRGREAGLLPEAWDRHL